MRGMWKFIWLLGVALGSTSVWGSEPTSKEADGAELRRVMHGLFSSLKVVYKSSLKDESWRPDSGRQEVEQAFQTLSDNASKLSGHMKHDLVFSYVGQSLETDIAQARHWYQNKAYQQSGFIVRHLVENCYACHTKRAQSTPFAAAFLDSKEEERLSLPELAHLKVATRQFDEAIAILDKIIGDQNYSFDDLMRNNVMALYLKLTVAIKKDPERAYQKLQTFYRGANDKNEGEALQQWVKDLADLKTKGTLLQPYDLSAAKAYLAVTGDMPMPAPEAKDLVRYVAAGAMLQGVVASAKTSNATRAESYYLLGYIEDAAARSFWISEGQYYWEAAIRSLPHSSIAILAFDELRERIHMGYSGSSGVQIPADVTAWLKRLESLAKIPARPNAKRSR